MLKPDLYIHSVLDIKVEYLNSLNIEHIIFDLDNTLVVNNSFEIDQKILDKLKELKDNNFNLYIVSNSRKPRVTNLAKKFGLKYYYSAFKPHKYRVLKFIKTNNIEIDKLVIVGDQMMTDIKLARRLNAKAILVDSLSLQTESVFTKINRVRENKFKRRLRYDD